jgi:uncharacterized membrane protein YkvI
MMIIAYLGAVIGAGFASGQEIMQFFLVYGEQGLKGTIMASVLFAGCGGMLIYTAHRSKASSYQKVLAYLFGRKTAGIIDILLAVFLFLGIGTMLSASGAIFYEHLYLPKALGIFLAFFLVILFLASGKKGLVFSYNLLVPVKLLLLLVITAYAAFFADTGQTEPAKAFLAPENYGLWAISSILYVAYNFSLAMVVLTEYQSLGTRRNAMTGAVWGGLVLGGLLILTYLALSRFMPQVINYQVPMLYIAGEVSLMTKHIYTMVLWVGILTTALANAYGFAQRFASFTGLSYSLCLFLCMSLALPVAFRSFSGLVAKVYPIFGILGLVIVSALLYKTGKDIARVLYYNIMQLMKGTKEV